jgi:hypothetical protein
LKTWDQSFATNYIQRLHLPKMQTFLIVVAVAVVVAVVVVGEV